MEFKVRRETEYRIIRVIVGPNTEYYVEITRYSLVGKSMHYIYFDEGVKVYDGIGYPEDHFKSIEECMEIIKKYYDLYHEETSMFEIDTKTINNLTI
jgi:hypothetical protein